MMRFTWVAWIGLGACAPEQAAGTGVLYVADLQGGAVRVFDAADGADLGVAADGGSLPEGVASRGFEPSAVARWRDELLVANFTSGEVFAFDLGGNFLRVVHDNALSPGGPRLEEPCELRVVGDQVLALGNDSRNVVVLDPEQGALYELGDDPSGPSLRSAHGFGVGPDGLIYISTSPTTRDAGLVQVWDPATATWVRDFAPWPELDEGTGAVVEPSGTLLVVDWFGGQAVRYDPFSGLLVGRLTTSLVDPVSATYDASGALYVLDARGVIELDPSTGAARRLVVDAARAGLVWPRQVAAYPSR